MAKYYLTMKDYMDLENRQGSHYSSLQDQIFLLSRFCKKTEEQIKQMEIKESIKLMNEMNKYIEEISKIDMKNIPNEIIKTNRFELMDL